MAEGTVLGMVRKGNISMHVQNSNPVLPGRDRLRKRHSMRDANANGSLPQVKWRLMQADIKLLVYYKNQYSRVLVK